MADEAGAPKKGWISKVFKTAAKVALLSFPLAVGASLLFDPTWLLVFHDTNNLMAQAWIDKISPYTEWLPHHLGLKGEGGLLYDFMTSFLGDELAAIITRKESAAALTSFSSVSEPPVDAVAMCSLKEAALGLC